MSNSDQSDSLQEQLVSLEVDRTALTIRAVQAERRLEKSEERLAGAVEGLNASLASLEEQLKSANADLESAKNDLTAEKARTNELAARFADSARKQDSLQRGSQHAREDIRVIQAKLFAAEDKIERMQTRAALLQEQRDVARSQLARTKQTLAFGLGQIIVSAFTSWSGFIRFPREIVLLSRNVRAKKKERSRLAAQTRLPPEEGETEQAPPIQHKTSTAAASKPRLRPPPQEAPALLTAPADCNLRIAAVMDEFTTLSYAPECDLLQLNPYRCIEQLGEFEPNLLFIESAWKGLDDLWKLKISKPSEEILEAIQWCRDNAVPVMFWNKEDPVHFDTFLEIASQADYVFTTDIDCIPKYKHRLGHDRVFLLPFAAQPYAQNPIETYDRKDAFCFAGSYYLRYPERQRDFDTLIESTRDFRPVEIFDRNYEKPHPHYTFPDQYRDMILGRLDFSDIDRAYKGYRFGININTIKQSQTMFARRVFELLASNTIAISNFSRGLRLFFGDIVIASDNSDQLRRRIAGINEAPNGYRRSRLLGLRKVMSEHLYRHRIEYIRARLSNQDYSPERPLIVAAAIARTEDEITKIIELYDRQSHTKKQLFILTDTPCPSVVDRDDIQQIDDHRHCTEAIMAALCDARFFAMLHSEDYYGPHYFTDLALSDEYSDAAAFGKASFFSAIDGTCELINPDTQYRPAQRLMARRSLIRASSVTSEWLEASLRDPETAEVQLETMLAVDEFHYCEQASTIDQQTLKQWVGDIELADQGASLVDGIFAVAKRVKAPFNSKEETGPNGSTGISEFLGSELLSMLVKPESTRLNLAKNDSQMVLSSTMAPERHVYIYTKSTLTREQCNFVLDSRYQLHCEGDLDLRMVFEFQDENGTKISHAINPAGHTVSLPIPAHCTQLRLGVRIQGSGHARIDSLSFGGLDEKPVVMIGRSRTLVLARKYPSPEALYSYGFLHSRVRGYRDAEKTVDVFRLNDILDERRFREFEGIDVVTGDTALLQATLASGQHNHILIHLLNRQMWSILRDYVDTIPMTVWIHGSEIQPFHRRSFNMTGMSASEIDRQQTLGDQRIEFWRNLLDDMPSTLHLVFVSQYLAEQVMEDLGFRIPEDRYSVIHNPIDTDMFEYAEKSADQRKKIVSIRPYSSRTYANDLTVQAIEILKEKEFFDELEFRIIGDGPLFEATVAPIRDLPNVIVEQAFLTQPEIAKVHKDYGICLIPTRMDTQGVSRDEAMASGLVPITNRVAAVPEFVDDSCGILVDPEDAAALASAIEMLFRDPEAFKTLSKAAAKRVRQQSAASHTLAAELSLIDRV